MVAKLDSERNHFFSCLHNCMRVGGGKILQSVKVIKPITVVLLATLITFVYFP